MAKLAVLFLVQTDDVNQPQIWKEFFESSNNEAVAYCHHKIPLSESSFLKDKCIKENYETQWGSFNISKAMMALLKESFKDESLTHFTFASESCIPLYSWQEIKNKLIADPRPRIDFRYYSQCENSEHQFRCQRSLYRADEWLHAQQWCVLDRECVKILIDNENDINKFRRVRCSDEHFIPVILKSRGYDIDNLVNNTRTTWADWSKGKRNPESYYELNDNILNEMKNSGCLFARKIHKSPKPIEELNFQAVMFMCNDFDRAKFTLTEFRKYHPDTKVTVINSGGADPTDQLKDFNVSVENCENFWHHGNLPGSFGPGMIKKLFEYGLDENYSHLLYLETDVKTNHKISIYPLYDISGAFNMCSASAYKLYEELNIPIPWLHTGSGGTMFSYNYFKTIAETNYHLIDELFEKYEQHYYADLILTVLAKITPGLTWGDWPAVSNIPGNFVNNDYEPVDMNATFVHNYKIDLIEK